MRDGENRVRDAQTMEFDFGIEENSRSNRANDDSLWSQCFCKKMGSAQ